jgi:hypothetical protein
MLTPNQPVCVLSLYCCRRIREATSTRFTTIYFVKYLIILVIRIRINLATSIEVDLIVILMKNIINRNSNSVYASKYTLTLSKLSVKYSFTSQNNKI